MPRIQISQEAARALKIAAAMKDKRPHTYMEELIFAACEPKEPEGPSSQVATTATKPKTKTRSIRPRISTRPEIMKQIVELADQGKGTSAIGRAVGYPATSIDGWLKKNYKKQGDIEG